MQNDSAVKQLMYKVASLIPDKVFLSLKYRKNFGRFPDWKNPKTFNEKLQWLKLYNRRPEYTIMVDKVKAKDYVAGIIGEEHIIPTLGVWDDPEDIDFDSLPNQFVLKCNHNSSTGMYICRDKSKMDVEKVKAGLRKGLKQNFYLCGREWPYKNVKRRIIAEAYIAPHEPGAPKDLTDYKFYCFDGTPKLVMVAGGRYSGDKRFGYYDTEWKPVNITWGAPRPDVEFERPADLDDMLRIASKLSANLPHARIDLYNINGHVYFGEITFFDSSGCERITPDSYDTVMGEWLKLPDNQQCKKKGGVIIKIVDGDVTVVPMSRDNDELKDYKFFCFNGKVMCFKIDFGRFVEHHANYYAPDGDLLPFGEVVYPPVYEHKETIPDNLDDMIEIAERLSRGLPFLRVDLYNMNGHIYFGELTFFPNSGMGAFTDEAWDKRLGDWISL